MNYLTVENISKAYGDNELFENLSFTISKGTKVAFVAKNGTGKTTLLKIVAGIEASDGPTARILLHKDVKLGYLDQSPSFFPGQTVLDAVFDAENAAIKAIREYESAMLHPNDQERLQKALERMDVLKAWDYEVRIKQILSKLSIDNFEQNVDTLSGGQQKRLALARVLINEPDFLILDEPTNHLDLAMIEWLEEYLSRSKLTLFMVTHDRYFLERVCDRIIELDRGQLYKYKGNYSYFLEKKTVRQEQLAREVYRAKSLLKYELEWMRRMPKARETKAKARIEAFYDLKEKASQQVGEDELHIPIKYTRLGSKILEMHNVSKRYGDLLLIDKFNYKFKKNDRVGIVGKNGTGKTTFLRLLLEQESTDTGKIVLGSTVQFGYYSQDGINLKEDQKVIDVVREVAEFIQGEKGRKITAATLLERFLFPRNMHYTYVRKLSGGEKRRLYLLTILMTNPNFLILDEPTNDLDIITLNVLEEFLLQFQGCLVIVSHDRYFMDKLVDHVFAFEGNGSIRDYPGNYTAYRDFQIEKTQESRSAEKPKQEKVNKRQIQKNANSGLSHEERKEFRRLEREIAKLEEKKTALSAKFNDPSLDHEAITELSKELGEITKQLEVKEDRWLELAELE
ncbi:MAG: ABC-F family ATP-binding cassette domain-containing protein [Bacteroidota bacterium]